MSVPSAILKILCGANAREINDIQEHESGLARPSDGNIVIKR
jgi:hypothetical protein